MTRLISVVSGKGGVGKTTLTTNLGIALTDMGYNVLVLDANLTTPNLSMHLGFPLFPVTIHDVLKGRADIFDAIYEYENGMKFIPAGIGINDLKGVDARDLANSIINLIGNIDIILIDSAAGLGREALSAVEASDEVLIITNPDLPSVTDALKAVKLSEKVGAKVLGVIVNRVKNKSHELSLPDIEDMLGLDIIEHIPESEMVQLAISKRKPIVHHNPRDITSQRVIKIAHSLVGSEYHISEPWYERLLKFLKK